MKAILERITDVLSLVVFILVSLLLIIPVAILGSPRIERISKAYRSEKSPMKKVS